MENKKIYVVYTDWNGSMTSDHRAVEINKAFTNIEKANEYIIDQLVNYEIIPRKYIFIEEIELE
jgi:hypothetical protein